MEISNNRKPGGAGATLALMSAKDPRFNLGVRFCPWLAKASAPVDPGKKKLATRV